jgi:glycerol transport system ATP-binding protein
VSLVLTGVAVQQRREVWLTDVDLELDRGMSVLIGPAGAGKTTLMRVISGLMPPTAGRILVGGTDVTGVSVRKRSIAFVYQQFINYPSMTVYDNIASPLRLGGRPGRAAIDRRVREVAERMGIEHLLTRRPAELSGGQQQRVAIARALARPVDVLLLDEPLANLDYKLREQLRGDLKAMFTDSPSVVLYSTSEPAEALHFAAPTVVLGEGRVLRTGAAIDLYERPPTLAVAAALSDPPLNLLTGIVRDGRIEFAGTSLPAPAAHASSRPVLLGVRPYRLTVHRTGPDDLQLPAEVRVAEVTGSATFLHVLAAGGANLVAELGGARVYVPGEPLHIYVNPADVMVFDGTDGRVLAQAATAVNIDG